MQKASVQESVEANPQDDVGALLRRLRRRQSVTLLQLVERLGCSESLLSKIERGHMRPTLRMLHQIARELDFEVAAVMGGSGGPTTTTIHGPDTRPQLKLSGQAKGKPPVVLERVVPWREGCVPDANLHVIPPGCGSEGTYSHEAEEVRFVVFGTALLRNPV